MPSLRLRVFAGPNGSGKSTFISQFPLNGKVHLGEYINADVIEASLDKLRNYKLSNLGISTNEIQEYLKTSQFSPIKINNLDLWKSFYIENNSIKISNELIMNSYIAADLADFLRRKYLEFKLSFSFETVLSDARKIDFLKEAKQMGYRIYLYFFCTIDPEININRVKIRTAQAGHSVSEDLIVKRYYKSLENLKPTTLISDRAFLFDSSENINRLIAEIQDGEDVEIKQLESIPNWFITYMM